MPKKIVKRKPKKVLKRKPKKVLKRKPKKVLKRKPKKVSKRKPKKVSKRRKFGMTFFSDDEDDEDDDDEYDFIPSKSYVPEGNPYTIFSKDQTKDRGSVKTKFITIMIRQLGLKSDKAGRSTSYNFKVNNLGTVVIEDGVVTKLDMDKWFKSINEDNMRETRFAKYRPVYNIIKLVFLTQLFILDKLGRAKRFTSTSNLLEGINMLNKSSKPFQNLNMILAEIARQTGDETLQVEAEYSDRGVLQSASLIDSKKRMALPKISLRTEFDPKLTKFELKKELLSMEPSPYSKDFYKKAYNTVKQAKSTEWKLAKDFIEDIKKYLYVNRRNLLNSESLKIYEVKTVSLSGFEKITSITHIADIEDGMTAVKISAQKKSAQKKSASLFSDSEDSEEEVEQIEETFVVDTLAGNLKKLSIKEKESDTLAGNLKKLSIKEKESDEEDLEDFLKSLEQLDIEDKKLGVYDKELGVKDLTDEEWEEFLKQKFGRRKKKKKVSKKKKGPSSSLKKLCKRLKVRLTTKRKGKRVYKSEKVLKSQCKKSAKKSSFGKPKKKVSKKKKSPSAALKKLCKSLKVKLTTKRAGKRVYKSEKVLKAQCKKASKAKSKKRRKSKFGG